MDTFHTVTFWQCTKCTTKIVHNLGKKVAYDLLKLCYNVINRAISSVLFPSFFPSQPLWTLWRRAYCGNCYYTYYLLWKFRNNPSKISMAEFKWWNSPIVLWCLERRRGKVFSNLRGTISWTTYGQFLPKKLWAKVELKILRKCAKYQTKSHNLAMSQILPKIGNKH